MKNEPSAGALRSSKRIYEAVCKVVGYCPPVDPDFSQIIEEETGLKELIEAGENAAAWMDCVTDLNCPKCVLLSAIAKAKGTA